MTQPPATKIQLINTPEYRENYANSVQVRVNLWDFFLMFGRVNQTSPDSVAIHNFQGVYVSPQQAKALLNVLRRMSPSTRRHSGRSSWSRRPRAASSSSLSRGAQVFQQQDHLVLLVGSARGAVCPRLLKARDSFGELRAIARAVHRRIQNAGAQKFGDELQFVGGQPGQEAPGLDFSG